MPPSVSCWPTPRAPAASRRKTKRSRRIGSGYIVLAMGKMGAFELNYSSDIDLIVFYDPAAPALPKDAEPAPLFVRITQRLVKLLQERTADGYVFRTDLRLRPDPASTAIAISTAAAISYYESTGQNWERAAMIKARACAGDIAAGEAILNDLSPFVWRKYLDFASVADVHAMKRQINAYRGHGEIAVEGHNIKLGRGGIREIEFFAQTQQLIAGGRNPHLRDRDTLTTLDKLAAGPLDRRGRARRHEGGLLFSCARSSTACRWSMTSRRRRCRPSATGLSASRAFSALPAATPSPRFCSVISTRCSATTPACSKRRRAPTGRRWRFRPTPTTARRWIGWPSSASARRWRPRTSSAIGWRRTSLAQGRGGARPSRGAAAGAARAIWRGPTIPTPRWCCSIVFSPICTARRGCCRCCGKIPI